MKILGGFFALVVYLVSFSANSEVLPKNVLDTKEEFDKVGATVCSTAIASTVAFIVKGRAIDSQRQWDTKKPNQSAISIDFAAAGGKTDYSLTGSVYLIPVGNKCEGTYTYTVVFPGSNCQSVMTDKGFVAPDWSELMNDPNGDGGKVVFMSAVKSSDLSFIFNDVAGGCSMLKRESITKDVSK
jgi:hypothetical protein